jgi:transcriptional regulator with XRE-family HTH domain
MRTDIETRMVENLKSLRRQEGLTIKGLSALCQGGELYQSIRDYESKKCIPAFATVYWVAKALNVSLDDLVRIDYTAEPASRETVGKNIRYLREERNLTRKAMSEMIHKSGTLISDWEAGRSGIDSSSTKILCDAFEVTPFDLLYQDLGALKKSDAGAAIVCPQCGVRVSKGQAQCGHCKSCFDWED